MENLTPIPGAGPDPRPLPPAPLSVGNTAEPADKPAVDEPRHRPHRHGNHGQGRRHVQQELHHLIRDVRHAIKDTLEDVDLGDETEDAIDGLQRTFRDELHQAVRDAGDGRRLDRQVLMDGVLAAVGNLTSGLQAIGDGLAPPPVPEVSPDTPVEATGLLVDALV
jgi:hypothetical protein